MFFCSPILAVCVLLLLGLSGCASGRAVTANDIGGHDWVLDPVDPFVLGKYATVLETCGFVDEAIEVQRRALEFVYENRGLQKALADDLKRLETSAQRQR